MKHPVTVTPNATDVRNTSTSAHDDYAQLRQSLHIMSLIVYCLAFILGVLGNGLVIWVTGFKMKKTVNTVWFLNLAVADFLFTAFLPLSVVYTAMDFHWPFGNFMCKLNSAVSSLNMFASVFILMVISVDRCLCVVRPVWAQNHRNIRKASWACMAVWAAAVVLCIPVFIFRDTIEPIDKLIFCYNNYDFDADPAQNSTSLRNFRLQAVTINRFVLAFLIPFTVIISCYAVIIHRLRTRPSLASQATRTFKIIAAVIIAFIICWVPFHCLTLLEIVNFSTSTEPFTHVISIAAPLATSMSFFNSCLNPLLYVFVGRDFKEEMSKCKSLRKLMEGALQEEEVYSKTVGVSHETCDSEL